ncbi:hypothetical protein IHN32_15895 [Deinococcus sp. 14RED07]|uniref:hypothetical protein n=1 Tax=Deinococcus sp. 14RED07 TaxID=2745874 RepID=UPI001E30D56B|nr:hypothetical protein [Deinococcus sp. 14RED07]MCD0177424.1 hypothetical protein [Deinococcus sp. 14RED07]
MPFILTRRRGRRVTLTLRARTRETQRLTLTLRASAAPGTYRVTLALRAGTAPGPAGRLTLTLHAQTTGRAGDPPVASEVLLGQPPLFTRTRLLLAGVPLDGLSWQHTRHDGYAEAEFTVRGAVRPARGDMMSVEVQQRLPGQGLTTVQYEPVPADGDYTVTRAPDGGYRTTFSGRTTQDQDLQNTRLSELIPWVASPSRQIQSPNYRSVTRQVAGVRDIVTLAFTEAGQDLSGLDVLQGEYWEETRREFSTGGRSPLDVFGDTYGRLNTRLILLNASWNLWLMLPPGTADGAARLRPEFLTALQEQAESSRTPARLTLQVGDLFTQVEDYLQEVVTTGTLPDVVGEDGEPQRLEIQDRPAARFEVSRDAVVTGFVDRDGRRTATLTRKRGGRVVQVVEVITGLIELTEPVTPDDVLARYRTLLHTSPYWQGQLIQLAQKRVLNVVFSVTETTFTYLPGSTDSQALAESLTTRTAYTYTYTTVPQGAQGIPAELASLVPGAVQGDLLGRESTRVRNVWSPQGGWLRERITVESRVGELGQTGLDDPGTAPPPVALTVEEYTTTETYKPTGGGYWLYTRLRIGPQKLPVRDMDAGEIVKTERRIGVLEHTTELTENAPPTLRDEVPDVDAQATGTVDSDDREGSISGLPWPRVTYLRDPQVATVLNQDGPAPEVSVTLDVVREQDRAQTLAGLLNTDYRPRVTRTLSTPEARALRPGQALDGLGIIRLVTARGQGHNHTLEVETVEIRRE